MQLFKKPLVEGYDYDKTHSTEGKRLRLQSKLLKNFDSDVFKEVFNKYSDITILDIGCNEGDAAIDRMIGYPIKTYIGIDRSQVAIDNATKKYGSDVVNFFKYDIENPMLSVDLYTILNKCNVEQVDVIMCSMVMLHLKDPAKVISILYPFLRRGGTLYIKDIDDRDNKASADPSGIFDYSYKIAVANKDSGNRQVGREIEKYMIDAGYSNVRCVRRGLSSLGMSKEEIDALFALYYGFFIEDCEAQCAYEEGSKQSIYNLGWCHYYLPKIKELFHQKGFTWVIGFCTYLAEKRD